MDTHITQNRFQWVLLAATSIAVAIFTANGFYKEWLYTSYRQLYWVHDALSFVAIPVFIVLLAHFVCKIEPYEYGLNFKTKYSMPGDFIVQMVISGVLFVASYYIVLWTTRLWIPPSHGASFYADAMPKMLLYKYAVTMYYSATAAFSEEVIFRGLIFYYVMKHLPQRRQFVGYVAISSTLFGLIHWENGLGEVLATFSTGVAASVYFYKIRTLWPLISAHFITDLLVFS